MVHRYQKFCKYQHAHCTVTWILVYANIMFVPVCYVWVSEWVRAGGRAGGRARARADGRTNEWIWDMWNREIKTTVIVRDLQYATVVSYFGCCVCGNLVIGDVFILCYSKLDTKNRRVPFSTQRYITIPDFNIGMSTSSIQMGYAD